MKIELNQTYVSRDGKHYRVTKQVGPDTRGDEQGNQWDVDSGLALQTGMDWDGLTGPMDLMVRLDVITPVTSTPIRMDTVGFITDERVLDFMAASDHPAPEATMNGFAVVPMADFDKSEPPACSDTFHTYSIVGQNASNTTKHHTFGDLTIFHGETSMIGWDDKPVAADKRYIIIADAHTGKRLKVFLPTE